MPKRITKNTKTDFIVNMTKTGFMKLTFIFLALAVVGVGVSCLPYYFELDTKLMSGGMNESTAMTISMTQAIDVLKNSVILLMCFGFFGYLVLLVSGTKKYFKPKENLPMLLLGGYLLLCALSTALAFDKTTALFGSQGRFEGLISIISYAGFFLAASQLTDNKLKAKLLMVVTAVASVHSAVGIFQGLEPTFDVLPSFFSENYTLLNGITSQQFVANGFATSPYALSALATMALAVCFAGIMYAENKKTVAFFSVCGAICAVGGILTKNLAVVVGFVAVALTLAVVEIVRIKSGHGLFVKGLLKNPLGRLFVSIVAVAVVWGFLLANGSFTFADSYIILQDSFYRLFLSHPAYHAEGVKVYPYVWAETWGIIKNNFVFGTGLDCIGMEKFGIPQSLEIVGSCDRAYNEYLNIAASTGVVSLVLYLGFVAGCVKRGVCGIKNFFNLNDNWTKVAAFAGCVGYILLAMFSTSTIVSTPVFFVLMGLMFSKTEK